MDYDEEKNCNVAENSLKRNNNICFEYADVTQFQFQPCDVVFLNDVLHYLAQNQQFEVLKIVG
ncbi:MAG: hypothetical protein R2779_11930 [Crocinitomicaceae bacterium]